MTPWKVLELMSLLTILDFSLGWLVVFILHVLCRILLIQTEPALEYAVGFIIGP